MDTKLRNIDEVEFTNHAKEAINGDRIDVPAFLIKNMIQKQQGMTFRPKGDKEGVYHQVKANTTAVFRVEERENGVVAAVLTVYRKNRHKYKSGKFARVDN